MKKNVIILTALVIGAAAIIFYALARKGTPAVNQSSGEQIAAKPQIVASFYPLYFFAAEIFGGNAEVYNVTPAGAEPHDYEPTAREMAKIISGDLLILNGRLETWGDRIKDDLLKQGKSVLVVSEGARLNNFIDEDGKTSLDPHIWLSPKLAKEAADKIAAALIELDASRAEVYLARAKELALKLENLNQNYQTGLSGCALKSFVTSHAAFGYLAKEYGLTQVGIAGLSPDAEPSPKEMAEVANFVRNNQIKHIFFESLVSPKLAETIAAEAGVQTLVLNPLEGLTDEEIAGGQNYFSVMQNNLANLKIALQCP